MHLLALMGLTWVQEGSREAVLLLYWLHFFFSLICEKMLICRLLAMAAWSDLWAIPHLDEFYFLPTALDFPPINACYQIGLFPRFEAQIQTVCFAASVISRKGKGNGDVGEMGRTSNKLPSENQAVDVAVTGYTSWPDTPRSRWYQV